MRYVNSLTNPIYPSWLTKNISESGIIGNASKASKAKDEKLLEITVREFSGLLREVARM
jgi:creatinine amidohydrolase/Fe(II)-dependent formamide hydrolase-like protein